MGSNTEVRFIPSGVHKLELKNAVPVAEKNYDNLTNKPQINGVELTGNVQGSTLEILPAVTEDDNGKFLCVHDGVWAAVSIPEANGVSF